MTNIGALAADLVEYFEQGLRKARALYVATKDLVVETTDKPSAVANGAIVGEPGPAEDAPAVDGDGAEGRPTP